MVNGARRLRWSGKKVVNPRHNSFIVLSKRINRRIPDDKKNFGKDQNKKPGGIASKFSLAIFFRQPLLLTDMKET